MKEENVKNVKKEKLNVYGKIQNVKEKLLKANLKKSGQNKFAGFTYYELSDFLPTIITLCNEEKLFTKVSFDKEVAMLEIINVEVPTEYVSYSSPMEELELKGCNKIQALGGTETYQRRYLYMCAFDIIENDMFDSVVEEEKITDKQKEMILSRYQGENLEKLLKVNNLSKIEDMTSKKASDLISNLMKIGK